MHPLSKVAMPPRNQQKPRQHRSLFVAGEEGIDVMNVVLLSGRLSKDPVMRTLQSGSLLCSLEVATSVGTGTQSVPVAWFDPSSTAEWSMGDEVVVFGTVRRRFFRTGAMTQSRTEVVAEAVVLAKDRRRVNKLFVRATSALQAPA